MRPRTDRQTHTQTRVTTTQFASSTTHAKCSKIKQINKTAVCDRQTDGRTDGHRATAYTHVRCAVRLGACFERTCADRQSTAQLDVHVVHVHDVLVVRRQPHPHCVRRHTRETLGAGDHVRISAVLDLPGHTQCCSS